MPTQALRTLRAPSTAHRDRLAQRSLPTPAHLVWRRAVLGAAAVTILWTCRNRLGFAGEPPPIAAAGRRRHWLQV